MVVVKQRVLLTLAKIELYAQFKGDMDNLSRAGIDSEKAGNV